MARVCKVLIVENDDHISELLGEAFDEEGFLFTTVETGAEMEDKLDEDDYDIVVIDVTQPGDKDGFALAEIARAQGCGVILTTGDHRHSERLEASGHVYLLKPFRMRDLMTTVDKILTIASIECVRHKRRNGSCFPLRSE
ncbi:MAG: response regulator [Alphaproteobacteria bacterium]|nr:response regulator [Alphaproteobacteria bacterium]